MSGRGGEEVGMPTREKVGGGALQGRRERAKRSSSREAREGRGGLDTMLVNLMVFSGLTS